MSKNQKLEFGGTNADLSGMTALHLARMNAGGTALEGAGVAVSDLATASHTHESSDITLPQVGSVDGGRTLTRDFTTRGSAGVIDGTITYITAAGGANIDVAAGEGYLRTSNDQQGDLKFIEWAASAGITIPTPAAGAETVRFIGVEYNAGTPQVTVRTSFNWNWYSDFPLGRVSYDGTTVRILNAYAHAEDTANLTRKYLRTVLPFQRETAPEGTGGLVAGETNIPGAPTLYRYVTLSTGAVWHGFNRYVIDAIDTSIPTGGTVRLYNYAVGGGFSSSASTTWPNTQFSPITGGLTTMGANKYANLWVYLDVADEGVDILYGSAEYATSALAQAETPPATLPDHLTYHGKLIARWVFQKSADTLTLNQSAWSMDFATTPVTDHGNLAGLGDDDHTQYLLKSLGTAADKMLYTTAASTWTETALTAAARTVLDDATVADMVDTLGGASSVGTGGLVRRTSPLLSNPGVDTLYDSSGSGAVLTLAGGVSQPVHLALDAGTTGNPVELIATGEVNASLNLASSGSGTVQINGSNALKASDIGSLVQAYDADLTTWAGVTPGTNVGTFLATPTSANLRAALTDENGTGAALFDSATGVTLSGAFTQATNNVASFKGKPTSGTNEYSFYVNSSNEWELRQNVGGIVNATYKFGGTAVYPGGKEDLGTTSAGWGSVILSGATSGTAQVIPPAVAGSGTVHTLPNATATIPGVVAVIDLPGTTAAEQLNQALYTPPAAGFYRVSAFAVVVTAATTSSTLAGTTAGQQGISIQYTDSDSNTAITQTIPTYINTAVYTSVNAANTVGALLTGDTTMYVKASTAMTYSIGYTSSGATSMKYALHLKVEAL